MNWLVNTSIDFANPAGLLDITAIPTRLSDLGTLALTLAMPVLCFFLVIESIRQTKEAVEGKAEYGSLFIRILGIIVGFVLYNQLFLLPVRAGFALENAILDVHTYQLAIARLDAFTDAQAGFNLFSDLQIVVGWASTYVARLLTAILQAGQFAVLSLLFFLGPFVLAASIFQPARYLLGTWFKSVLSVALWSLFIRLTLRVMMSIGFLTVFETKVGSADLLQVSVASLTFLVLLAFAPLMAERFVSGQAFGAVATMATGLMAAKGGALMKATSPYFAKKAEQAKEKIVAAFPKWTGTRTDQRDARLSRTKSKESRS